MDAALTLPVRTSNTSSNPLGLVTLVRIGSMAVRRTDEQLAEAARLYYLDGLNQGEIAEALETTRSNVSRMLASARDQGIVRFHVSHPLGRQHVLEERLVETFGLREALVLSADAGGDVLARTGDLAARWLAERIVDGQTLAVSWGRTLKAMAQHVHVDRAREVRVVQIGGDLQLDPRLSGHDLVRDLAARLGGGYSYLHAPALLDSPQMVADLRANTNISRELDKARSADLAIVGIGGFGEGFSAQIVESAHLTAAERAELESREPAGDIAARFFDDEGKPFDSPLRDRVLALEFDELRQIPLVVGVAAGNEKARGVWGALRGRLIDVLVCDQSAAAAALRLQNEVP
ncbi:sugar-binding transcriptional regulator [Egibacter rhizosphaerae]|uniref:Sugar-binding transcriptional regulator n=1 Tax=Egibacter rhizosphaerae TaxID=1670831 RepID=A0A411YDN1_9ACTN|nr:sugar-binding transcriptional regulator [Egibacter rhizosphaerae]QBI19262.1 sugar-binding transcriptional regulator [Egibacter rhizosphaerae]